MNREELKSSAKASLQGKYPETIKMIVIYFAINFAIGFVIGLIGGIANMDRQILSGFTSIISTVVSCLLILGLNSYFLKISRNETVSYKELFSKTNLFAFCLSLTILVGIFTYLWLLLFIIPGIIAAISYSQAYYIALDNPNLSAKECIDESKKLMNGHKMDYFLLHLSFIGWILLGALTLGILYFWLIPYMSVTEANFYNKLIENK